MATSTTTLAPDLQLHSWIGENATGHLLVRRGRSLLIDCPAGPLREWITTAKLPLPELILHTHVQPEHCCEADQFPAAQILVHAELAELASDRAAYERAARTVWENPAEWPVTLGREKYGIAGCVTEFPPAIPLKITGTFRAGDRLPWQDLILEVISLPGHSRHAVGFALEQSAIFTGDLFCNHARLVNVYDLETNYGGTALPQLPATLRALAARPARRYFPATGPALTDGPAQATELADAIDAYLQALRWKSGQFEPTPTPDYPRVGRYRQLHRGVYQIDNFGNCILLIDEAGRGLMVDPGPCDFESPERTANFHRDLDRFERDHGLKTIDTALITHVHGDHYDMAPELRRRYGCRVAALDLVARVLEAPRDYPYAALLPWYNLGIERVPVDDVLRTDAAYDWHGVPIRSLHLPGHCYCHAAYLLSFHGRQLAITGDTIQTRGDAGGLEFIIANHSVPDEHSGILKAYRQMVTVPVDLNIGGHSSRFTGCAAVYAESLRRIEYALPYLRRLVRAGDLPAAFVRPAGLRLV